jgi:hypothetical protein
MWRYFFTTTCLDIGYPAEFGSTEVPPEIA